MLKPNELMAEIKATVENKKDYLVPAGNLRAVAEPGEGVRLKVMRGQTFAMRRHAHRQLQQWLGIPKAYYDKMESEAPDLLVKNANHWLHRHGEQEKPTRRLLRTITMEKEQPNELRALLSPRYKIMDNYDLLRNLMPVIKKSKAQPWRAAVSEERINILFVCQQMMATVSADAPNAHKVHKFDDHRVYAALNIGNSEVGSGGMEVSISAIIAACSNMYIGLTEVRKVHLGREIEGVGDVTALYSEQTKEYMQETVWRQTRDIIEGTFNEESFGAMVQGFQTVRNIEIDKPVEVLRSIADREGFDPDGLLEAFMKEPEPSGFGIVQAITRADGTDEDRVKAAKVAGSLVHGDETEAELREYFSPDSDLVSDIEEEAA